MEIKKAPAALAEMLIRRPPAEVFEAFIDPDITSKFWFTHGSGRLDKNSKVTWEWRMYSVSTPVKVREIVKDENTSIADYVWLPIRFDGDMAYLDWHDEWRIEDYT